MKTKKEFSWVKRKVITEKEKKIKHINNFELEDWKKLGKEITEHVMEENFNLGLPIVYSKKIGNEDWIVNEYSDGRIEKIKNITKK